MNVITIDFVVAAVSRGDRRTGFVIGKSHRRSGCRGIPLGDGTVNRSPEKHRRSRVKM